MPKSENSSWRTLLLTAAAALLVVAALVAWLMPRTVEVQPRECALTPSAHHHGTFQNWRLSMSPGEGMSGEVSAAIQLDDGRDVVAYNVTNAGGLTPGDKVTVAEIQCIHRRIFLLATPGSDAAPPTN